MPRIFSEELKLNLMTKLDESKEILFGPFTDQVTRRDRAEEWQKIFEYASFIGYTFPDKADYGYLRGTVWPNFRKRTSEKMEKQTAGEQIYFDKIDEIVMRIINFIGYEKKSQNFSVNSNNSTTNDNDFLREIKRENDSDESNFSVQNFSSPVVVEPAIEISEENLHFSRENKKRTIGDESEDSSPKKTKVCQKVFDEFSDSTTPDVITNDDLKRLEAENLRLKNYKLKLEIYALETQLGLKNPMNNGL